MSAASLEATQRWMHGALVRPGQVAPGEVVEVLVASGPLGGAAGLGIYQRGYFLRISACMREQFPALCHALGQPLFDDFTADYIAALPPVSHSLYDLGRRFADWMGANRPDAALPEAEREPWIDFMIDLARFEYRVFAMFDAPGNEGRPFATHATPDARLRLQPCFALGAYDFPVADYYHAVRRGEDPALPPPGASHVALVRVDYVTRTVPLARMHHGFLAAMAKGADVDAALAAVAAELGAPVADIRDSWHADRGSRARWIDWGLFVDARDCG